MKKTVVLCSSANFYKHLVDVAEQLEKLDFDVILPETAAKMKRLNNYDINVSRTWLNNPSKFSEKTRLMKAHFDAIKRADTVLVINDEKRGIKGYIGANVLIEMGLAFYKSKPIYILNNYDNSMPYDEEVKAMRAIIIEEDLSKIKQ
jgi:nucleoside 2-deoxyribosyltransferase